MEQPSVVSIISTRRKALGLTQQALADQLHISNKSISKWETGEGLPDISILKELATALQISVDELLGKTSTPLVAVKQAPNKARLVRLLSRSSLLAIHLFPFITLNVSDAVPSGIGNVFDAIFGNKLVLVYSGYTLLTNNSWIGRFVLISFVLNLILLGLDLVRPIQDPDFKGLIRVAYWTLLGLAILIPISGLAMGLTLGIGLILSTVFNLSLCLNALSFFKRK